MESDLYRYKIAYDVMKEIEADPKKFYVNPGTKCAHAVTIIKNVLANVVASSKEI